MVVRLHCPVVTQDQVQHVTRTRTPTMVGRTSVMVTLVVWWTRTEMRRTANMLTTDRMVTGSRAMVTRVTQMVRTVVKMSDHCSTVTLIRHTLYTSSAHAWYRQLAMRCEVNTIHSA